LTNGKWAALPTICLTSLPGAVPALSPISTISPDKKTLNCNLGIQYEGSSISFDAVANVDYTINDSIISATISATGDNGNIATETSNPTIITGAPKMDLVKSHDTYLAEDNISIVHTPAYTKNQCYNRATGVSTLSSPSISTNDGCPGDTETGVIIMYKLKF
jgi:hypothetical protein